MGGASKIARSAVQGRCILGCITTSGLAWRSTGEHSRRRRWYSVISKVCASSQGMHVELKSRCGLTWMGAGAAAKNWAKTVGRAAGNSRPGSQTLNLRSRVGVGGGVGGVSLKDAWGVDSRVPHLRFRVWRQSRRIGPSSFEISVRASRRWLVHPGSERCAPSSEVIRGQVGRATQVA